DSVLHDSFEWNVDKAAHAHWVSVANQIINGYTVETTVETRTMKTPVFVRDVASPKRFVPIDRMAQEKELAKASLRRELDRVLAALGRMRGIAAGLGLLDVVEDIARAETSARRAVEG